MVRRLSPTVLLCLAVLCFATRFAAADAAFHVDESATRASLRDDATEISLAFVNPTGRDFTARVVAELLYTSGAVRARVEGDERVKAGAGALKVSFPGSLLGPNERASLPWYRLRYSITPAGGDASAAGIAPAEGIVSLSEITPGLVELNVSTPAYAFEGMHFRARVYAAHPVSRRPARGVRVEAEATLDQDEDEDDDTGDGEAAKVLRARGTTGEDGYVTLDFELPRNVSADGIELKVAGRLGDFVQEARDSVPLYHLAEILVSTDKPIYQPGQTLHLRALLIDPLARRALPDAAATLKINDPDGSNVFTSRLRTSRFGVASCDWPIAEGTRLGNYRVEIEVEDGAYDDSYGGTEFRVSRYELPNFVVNVKADRKFYLPGEDAEVEVRADYLFGKPVPRGRVRLVREEEREWNYEAQKWEVVEKETYEGEADAGGRFVARIPLAGEHGKLAEEDEDTRFKDVPFAAYFTDPTTNRTEQRRLYLRVSREAIHVYVVEKRYGDNSPGFPVEFYVTTFYADGTPAQAVVSVAEDFSREEVAAYPQLPAGALVPPTLAEVRTNGFGLAKVGGLKLRPAAPDDDESPKLRVVARDAEGRTGGTSETFILRDETRIRVETDKTIYRRGEPVRAHITSNRPGLALAVDAIQGGRVFHSQTVRLRDGRAAVQIPYRKEFRDEVSISAYTLEDPDSPDTNTRVVLFPRERELQFDVRLDREEYRPGEEARAEISVRDAEGREVESALGVVVTDRAVEERARTDREFGGGGRWGGYDGYVRVRLGENDSVSGVTRRDLNRVDFTRPLPDGLDLLAEIMLNKDVSFTLNTFGQGFADVGQSVFGGLIAKQLQPLRAALEARFKERDEYPRDAATLRRHLSEAGVELDALRDPWGRPFEIRFGTDDDKDFVAFVSAAADERPQTDDDFVALRLDWPYFKSTGPKFDQALKRYFERTGGLLSSRAELEAELLREGLDFGALRDRWGQPYEVEFETEGRYQVLHVRSGGPDGRLNERKRRGWYETDDFTVWSARVDWLAPVEERVGLALGQHISATRALPKTDAELREALRRGGVESASLLDARGLPLVLKFTEKDWPSVRHRMVTYARFGAKSQQRAEPLATAKQKVFTVSLYSSGADAQADTADDFQLGAVSRVLDVEPEPTPAPRRARTNMPGDAMLKGTVTDPNGAVVPNVTVVCTNKETRESRRTRTNEEGVFVFDGLPAGTYEVFFTGSMGFLPATITDVPLRDALVTELDAEIQPGATVETVTVMADSSQTINTTSASVASFVRMPVTTGAANAPDKSGATETPRLREDFPETLVWQPSIETDGGGRASLRFNLADNITTWKLAVIGSTLDGELGIAEREIRAFQPFFAEHDPPRVLTEGDEISLPVVLRNYLDREQDVRVELKPEPWFTLLGPAEKRASVPAGDAARATFDLRAAAFVREGRSRVTAYGSDASDAVEKKLSVHPDGEEVFDSAGGVFNDSVALDLNFPAATVNGSARAELKIYPNLMSHVVDGVEAIMRRPYGCGEQTISSTYPSLLVLLHHKRQGGDPPAVARRAEAYLRAGYQRLAGYRTPDGGFSYWGGDQKADTALTAYALMFLEDAADIIHVNPDLAAGARAWLARNQHADGTWLASEWSGVERKRRTLMLTAYVSRVLAGGGAKASAEKTQAGGEEAKAVAASLKRALDFLARQPDKAADPYVLASYTLARVALGETEAASQSAVKLAALAREDARGKYWETPQETPFNGWGLAGRIETTALAVRAMRAASADSALAHDGLAYLLSVKDEHGVWYSTQATVNVLGALNAFDAGGGAPSPNASAAAAEVFVNGSHAATVPAARAAGLNAPTVVDLSPFVNAPGNNRVEIRRPRGSSQASALLAASYYVPWADAPSLRPAPARDAASAPRFKVSFDRTETAAGQPVKCEVEVARGSAGYGMLLAEVGLPPGVEVDRASLEQARTAPGSNFSHYDVLPDRVVLYLWPYHNAPSRLSFTFTPRYNLRALTAPSQVYDYYNPKARAVVAPVKFVVR